MLSISASHPYQGFAHTTEQQSSNVTAGGSPSVIEPIGQPLQHSASVVDVESADQIEHHDGHGLCQPVGRQFGRRARRGLGRS